MKSTPPGAEKPASKFFTVPTSRRTAAIVSGSALVLGIAMGSGTAGANSASEIEQLTADLATSESQNDLLASQLEQLKNTNERISKSESTKAETITSLRSDLTTANSTTQTQAARIAELETALAAATATAPPVTVPVPFVAPPPTAAYYKNCTAARNAGAAPVYRGDPGYGPHLDRDGDGVGCE